MKRYCPLGSGSKGNSTFIETEGAKLLIDAGLSAKALGERLGEIGVGLHEIDAILITHEHIDHIRGVGPLASKLQIPVFANAETAKAIFASLGICPSFTIFATGEAFTYADLTIHPFTIPHDAIDPVGFTLTSNGWKLGVCTDLGYATTLVRHELRGCTHLILEANHHPPMVHASSRPQSLKQRILGKSGHLSNEASGLLLKEIYHPGLREVHLAHLSQECNTPETALTIVRAQIPEYCDALSLSVAPQHIRAEVVHISSPCPALA